MEPKGGPVRRLTSPIGSVDCGRGEEGFTLLEVICVLAIIAMITAVILPAIPRGTSRPRLEAYAVEMAAMLKADRNAAMRRHAPVVARIDAAERSMRSGSTGHVVQVPADVTFDALLSARCNQRPAGSTIQFFASGMSCGGVIAITRLGTGYEIRVQWLTGGVDVVPRSTL